jgi:hypothetical protein
MLKAILFTSFVFVHGCTTTSPDLLGSHAEDSFPENIRVSPKRLHIYLYPHVNALGDHVAGAWIKIEDPR